MSLNRISRGSWGSRRQLAKQLPLDDASAGAARSHQCIVPAVGVDKVLAQQGVDGGSAAKGVSHSRQIFRGHIALSNGLQLCS